MGQGLSKMFPALTQDLRTLAEFYRQILFIFLPKRKGKKKKKQARNVNTSEVGGKKVRLLWKVHHLLITLDVEFVVEPDGFTTDSFGGCYFYEFLRRLHNVSHSDSPPSISLSTQLWVLFVF